MHFVFRLNSVGFPSKYKRRVCNTVCDTLLTIDSSQYYFPMTLLLSVGWAFLSADVGPKSTEPKNEIENETTDETREDKTSSPFWLRTQSRHQRRRSQLWRHLLLLRPKRWAQNWHYFPSTTHIKRDTAILKSALFKAFWTPTVVSFSRWLFTPVWAFYTSKMS